MSDIVFMDTETLGLDINSPIWEFAAIRRSAETGEGVARMHLFIDHDPGHWLRDFPQEFAQDYLKRYGEAAGQNRLFSPSTAAGMIYDFLHDRPHIVGAVPDFDTTRIRHQLLAPHGITDPWHYHLIDIENVVVGWLRGHYAAAGSDMQILPPYNSDELSLAVGINPEAFDRHTAMGDVLWVQAQWDAVMGGAE